MRTHRAVRIGPWHLKHIGRITPGLRALVLVEPQRLVGQGRAGQNADRASSSPAAATITPVSPRATSVAATGPTRRVDFRCVKDDVPAMVERLEYDPNRTAFIALLKYQERHLVVYFWRRSA